METLVERRVALDVALIVVEAAGGFATGGGHANRQMVGVALARQRETRSARRSNAQMCKPAPGRA
jgi:hypothetical protein